MPPRPSHRPPIPPRRTGPPAETAAETTSRLRPISAELPPEVNTRRGANPAEPVRRPGFPPRPAHEPPAPGRTDPPRTSPASTGQESDARTPSPTSGPGSDRRTPSPTSGPGSDRRTSSSAPGPGNGPRTPSASNGPASASRIPSAPTVPPSASIPLPPTAPASASRIPAPPTGPESASRIPPPPTAPPSTPSAPRIPSAPTSPPPDTTTLNPDPSFSWSAPMAPGGAPGSERPVISFGEPEGYDDRARPRSLRGRSRIAVVAACVVLGLGLIGGAVTGSWLSGESGEAGSDDTFATARDLWHSIPVDQLFPPTVEGQGAGPGGADRTWTRIAVAPDSGCQNAFDPLLRKALSTVGCARLLRATYTDATQSYVTTVGLLFTKADAAAMSALGKRFKDEGLDSRTDLMPRPYAAKDTVAAGFGTEQRASWTVSVLTDAPVVVYAVSGWADGRTVDPPQPAAEAMKSGATTAPAQAGLGNEAQGLADRVERGLRKTVSSPSEKPS
ncbi:hypothetical protein GCM10022232_31320 [Streptomyces plumbiresistens]|uniref:Uncharacterized protein n=1 Tax=Streptomyces plumbiresistens TaxID=511811 RepID=A0ABP7R7D8_9ACTN